MLDAMSDAASFVSLRYRVRPEPTRWVLPEGTVPECMDHDRAAERIKAILAAWATRLGRPVAVARNLAIRWVERAPQIGIDPDVCVLDPSPGEHLASLRLWKEGHAPPSICFEVVSENHPHKDYRDVHERYAAIGTEELVVFDPELAGPPSLGGPVTFQLWRRDATGAFERVAAGDGPVYSEVLRCWLSKDDRELVFSNDREGNERWLTAEERALARVAELEAKLENAPR
jgi:Uma2 family endonuclease